MNIINSYILYKKFRTCKSFNPKDPIKTHTLRFPAADRETIQPNLRCKSTVKFLQGSCRLEDRRKHKSRTETLKRNVLR